MNALASENKDGERTVRSPSFSILPFPHYRPEQVTLTCIGV
jgi:hypothetical protein